MIVDRANVKFDYVVKENSVYAVTIENGTESMVIIEFWGKDKWYSNDLERNNKPVTDVLEGVFALKNLLQIHWDLNTFNDENYAKILDMFDPLINRNRIFGTIEQFLLRANEWE